MINHVDKFEPANSNLLLRLIRKVKVKRLKLQKFRLKQNDKSEKIITPAESNKQWTCSKNTFQRIEEDLRKFQEAGFRNVHLDRFCKNRETVPDTCILKFQKTCRNNFDSYPLERLKKNPSSVCKTPNNNKNLQLDCHSVVPIFSQQGLLTLIDVSAKVALSM